MQIQIHVPDVVMQSKELEVLGPECAWRVSYTHWLPALPRKLDMDAMLHPLPWVDSRSRPLGSCCVAAEIPHCLPACRRSNGNQALHGPVSKRRHGRPRSDVWGHARLAPAAHDLIMNKSNRHAG